MASGQAGTSFAARGGVRCNYISKAGTAQRHVGTEQRPSFGRAAVTSGGSRRNTLRARLHDKRGSRGVMPIQAKHSAIPEAQVSLPEFVWSAIDVRFNVVF